jgi:dTDP-4-dehydrorhamnose reductase
MYRRVLITGGNGLLGQALIAQMSPSTEYDVLATGRQKAPLFSGGSCGYVSMDICNFGEVASVFQDFAPDVVINCAAMTQVDACEIERELCWQVNAEAVENLAKQCQKSGSHLIHVSTDFIFDGLSGPYREDARPNPLSYYGRSKLAGENGVRQAGLEQWSIARTVLVYGTGENLSRSNFVLWVVDSLSQGKQISVVTDQFRSPTYAPDLADGIERLVRFRKNGIDHLSGCETMSVYDIAVTAAEVFGLDASLISKTDSTQFKQTALRPPRTGFLVLKAETELGYKPHALKDALADLDRQLQARSSRTE